jgi:hypothetical protein
MTGHDELTRLEHMLAAARAVQNRLPPLIQQLEAVLR